MVGLWGTGSIHDVDVDIQKAEAEIEKKWAEHGENLTQEDGFLNLKGSSLGSGEKGRERLI